MGDCREDYAEAARQNQRFTNQWKGFGPKLGDIYLSKKERKAELQLIDSLLVQWSDKINTSSWKTLGRLFSKFGFDLKPFTNGNEFTGSFKELAQNEIEQAKKAEDNTGSARFYSFRDSLWNAELQPTWIPILVESGKLTQDQKKEIEDLVKNWESVVTPTSPYVYLLLGIIILLLGWGILVFMRKKPAEPAKES